MAPPSVSVPDDIWQSFSSDQLAQRSQSMLDGLKQKFTDAMTPSAPSSTTLAPSTGLPSLDALMSPFAPAARSLGASAVSGQMPDGSSPRPDDSSPPYTPTMSAPATSGLPSFQSLPSLGSLVQSAMPSMSSATPSTAASRQPALTTGPTASAAPLTIDHSSPQAFLGGLSTAATTALQRHNLPTTLAPILAAIPMNEQGWQKDAPGQNYYGLKGSNPRTGANTGPVGTWEDYGSGRQNIQDTFRAYDDPSESVDDFLSFLESNPRYSKALDVARQTGDPAGFIRAVHAAGYATDPAWSDKILSIAKTVPQQVSRQPALTSGPPPTPGEPGGPPLATTYRPLPTAAQASPPSGALDADGIVKAYAGTSYTYGGPGGRTAGFGAPTDCSGFTSAIFKSQYGLDLVPHTDGAYNQLKGLGATEVKTADARPGDVVFYLGAGTGGSVAHHMGVYAGDGKVLDDSVSGQDGVHVRDVGHAGQYVILRDPRLNTQTPASASAPPPIQPSGLAEQTGGAKVDQQQLAQAATSQTGGPPWAPTAPSAQAAPSQTSAPPGQPPTSPGSASADPSMMFRQPLSMTTLDQGQAPTWQDDQTQSGYVQPDMAPGPPVPDMSGTAAQAPDAPWRPPDATSSPLKPVYDLAGTVTGYVHTGLDAAANAVQGVAGAVQQAAPTVADQARGITPTGETPLQAGARAIGAGVEESMQPGQSLLDVPARLQGGASADEGALTELPEPYRSAALTARRAGYQLMTLAMPTAVAEHLWTAAGLPNVNIAGYEINPGMFLVPVPSGIGGTLENTAAGGLAAGAINRIPNIAGAIESGGSRATGAVLGAVRSGVSRVGQALDENAARVAALDAERAGQEAAPAYGALGVAPPASEPPPAQVPPYSPTAPEGFVRRYHGGSSDFAAVEPGKLNERSLWGPGYYVTDEPRVAGGIVDESGRVVSPGYAQERGLTSAGESKVAVLSNQRAAARMDLERAQARLQRAIDASPAFPQSQNVLAARRSLEPEIARAQARLDTLDQRLATAAGPNVRALDVPTSLNLLDTNQPAPADIVDRVGGLVEKAWGKDRQFGQWLSDEILTPLEQAQKQGPISGERLATTVRDAANAVEEPALIPEILKRLGYDGITHPGGLIRPMYDEAGQAIQHTATVIFPDSIGKVRNATAGTYGGAALGQAPAFPGAPTPRGSGFFDRATPILSQGLASSVSGGVGAAYEQQLGDPNDPNRALKGFAVGAAAPFLAGRAGAALGRRFGAAGETGAAEGALATAGNLPTRRGPPTAAAPSGLASFPGVQGALQRAQQRAASMKARGLTTPTGWDWIKQAGYSGVFGPATATAQLVGGALDLALAQPKEAARALLTGQGGRYGAQVKAQAQALPEAWHGLQDILLGKGGSSGAAAASGGSQGTANLSERVVNPIGHLTARALERPGEVLAEAPDAVFRPLFNAQGMQREADKIASEMGMKGARAASFADTLMQSAEQLRQSPGMRSASKEAQRVVDAGKAYADEMGYKGDPGGLNGWLAKQSRQPGFAGVLASFAVPFSRTTGNIARAAGRMTPGVGLLPGVRKTPLKSFDVAYDQAFGLLAGAGMLTYAANGGITGSGPDDPGERAMMVSKGWQPNSTLVPGGYYIPNRMFSKFQPLLDAVGEAHDAIAYQKKGADNAALATSIGKRVGKIATDQAGLSGLADIYDLFEGQGGLGSQLPGFAARQITRYAPFGGIIRAAAQSTDTNARKPESWSDVGFGPAVGQQLEQNVPGLRQNVPAAQDVLGRPAPNPQQGLGALIPRTTSQRDDPVVGAFQDANINIPAPRQKVTVADVPVDLTTDEQRRWNELRGEQLTRLMSSRVENGSLGRMNPVARQEVLKTLLQTASDIADAKVTAEMTNRSQRIRDAMQAEQQKKAS